MLCLFLFLAHVRKRRTSKWRSRCRDCRRWNGNSHVSCFAFIILLHGFLFNMTGLYKSPSWLLRRTRKNRWIRTRHYQQLVLCPARQVNDTFRAEVIEDGSSSRFMLGLSYSLSGSITCARIGRLKNHFMHASSPLHGDLLIMTLTNKAKLDM